MSIFRLSVRFFLIEIIGHNSKFLLLLGNFLLILGGVIILLNDSIVNSSMELYLLSPAIFNDFILFHIFLLGKKAKKS